MPQERILVVDDEPLMREFAEETLVRAGYTLDTASNGAAALEQLAQNPADLVVTDLKMTPMDGIEVVRRVRAEWPHTQLIVMTAYGTIETAVEALKAGASDYILKPFEPEEIERAVQRTLEKARLQRENTYLRKELNAPYDFETMVGETATMRDLYSQIERIADSRATVLIRGESGTGKELVARAIHFRSPRANGPFIKINCAALSAGLLESELFGHERGSFTGAHERKIGRFELADGGTILLDEISEIDIGLQPKLLRVLQEREFERVGGTRPITTDTRIICTSNRDLEKAVTNGDFREDLFFRLNVVPLHLPSLRDRRQDIPALLDYFLKRFAQENARPLTGFTEAALEALTAYDWPGNVRELQNAVERAVVLSRNARLDVDDFPLDPSRPRLAGAADVSVPVGTTVAQAERELILRTLEHSNQNRTHAAKILDISVRTLRNKLKEYGQQGELAAELETEDA